LLRDSAGEIN